MRLPSLILGTLFAITTLTFADEKQDTTAENKQTAREAAEKALVENGY